MININQPASRLGDYQANPHYAGDGTASFTGLLSRTEDFLDQLSAQRSGPVVVYTDGLFMRGVARSLLTGITRPDEERSAASPTSTSSPTPASSNCVTPMATLPPSWLALRFTCPLPPQRPR